MANSALPHSSIVRQDIKQYLKDANRLTSESINQAINCDIFRNIYKTTLATDAVLLELSAKLTPHPNSLRSGFRRIPVFISISQPNAACFQLRQMIEVTHLIVYFSQHPVEWLAFLESNGSGFTQDPNLPILFSASRPPAFFRNYSLERFQKEPSGTIKDALNSLSVRYAELSKIVHASKDVTSDTLTPEFTRLEKKELNNFKTMYCDIAASCCLTLMAFNVSAYNNLPPATKAWFSWLIGTKVDHKIKSGRFGLRNAF